MHEVPPPVGVFRSAHGKAATLGQTKVAEPCADGVRTVPEGSAAPVTRRKNGTVTPEGAAELARLRHEAAKVPDFGSKASPWLPPSEALKPFDAARQDLLRKRREEIHTMTGEVSAGVGAQLRAWAYIQAAGEFWASKFFSEGDPDAFARMVSAFKAASTEDAKLRDAAAWEAACRPKRKNAALANLRAAFSEDAD